MAESMEWTEYKCDSGQSLFIYNKVTGAHRWPTENSSGANMDGQPVVYKVLCSTATQTDDYGCDNGCSSVYIKRTEVSISLDQFVEQASSDTVKEKAMNVEDNSKQKQSQNTDDVSSEKNLLEFPISEEKNEDGSDFEITDSTSSKAVGNKNVEDSNKQKQSQITDKISFGKKLLEFPISEENIEDGIGIEITDLVSATHKVNEEQSSKPVCNKNDGKHDSKKPYECSYCEWKFRKKGDFTRHMRKHTGEKPFECTFCGKTFAQNSCLTTHLRKHTGEKPYTCTHCKDTFATKSAFRKHFSKRHTDREKRYECSYSYCEKRFAYKHELRDHLKRHIEEKPFRCVLCQKRFTLENELLEHLSIRHAGIKPFGCFICKKLFKLKPELNEHLELCKMQTGEKTFECVHCKKQFIQSSELKKHLTIHPGEKPLGC